MKVEKQEKVKFDRKELEKAQKKQEQKKEQEKEKDFVKIYALFVILGIVLTIMTLKIFPFEKLPGIFTMIQFTFRLFEFTSFFFAIISAVNFGILIKNFNIRDVVILSLIACLLTTIYGKKIS